MTKTYYISQLKEIYRLKKSAIFSRLKEFRNLWLHGSDEDIFAELAFCLLTPQSKAKSCWAATERLKEYNLLFDGSAEHIKKCLHHFVRFHNKKAEYLVRVRNHFMHDGVLSIKKQLNNFKNVYECRDWLVKNIKGFGYKEASHFLRNIGFGDKIAILDRHILKNLYKLGVIQEIPETISRSKYLNIEIKMAEFGKKHNIPLSHLDILLWFKETGEIFK
ncbi:MAG: N-glycosylase/DNA lyase [Nitrospirae bacterium]|nr:N-glycosylase/DNA lyase [Nitrospirota bacterium]